MGVLIGIFINILLNRSNLLKRFFSVFRYNILINIVFIIII